MLISLIIKFSAGVQPRQDQLDGVYFLLGMDFDRHAAPIVCDLQGTVLEHGDIDFFAVPADRLIDAVVDHLMRQVVRPRGIGVHAGAPAFTGSNPLSTSMSEAV